MTALVKHPRLWFPDGNIVLRSKPSPNYEVMNEEHAPEVAVQVNFCVHKSMLARQSQVFRDMLDLGADGGIGGELYEGLPLVVLEESAKDLEDILQTLYDPCSPALKRNHPDTPLLVEPILRMTAKYQFEGVRTRIVEHIRADWPSTMREWEQSEAHIEALSKPLDDGLPVIDLLVPEPAAAIRLARRFDIPEILPAAFFALSMMRDAHDYDKHRKLVDGAVGLAIPVAESDKDVIGPLHRTARWSLLDANDMRVLCKVREYLQVDFWSMIAYGRSATCMTTCEQNYKGMVALVQKHTADCGDILYALHVYQPQPQLNWCGGCRVRSANQFAAARAEIWPALANIVKTLPAL